MARLRQLIHKSKEAQFYERMAFEDILTGGKTGRLRPRSQAGDVLLSARRPALVVMDLNGLKSINDRYGHVMGDRALRTSTAA
jgi:GGDEF domain-containing protein